MVCHLDGVCLIKNLIYRATVSFVGKRGMIYTGQRIRTFKESLAYHNTCLGNFFKRKHCSLASYIWDLEMHNRGWSIKWEKIKECTTYSRESKRCDLCDSEKHEILKRMIEDSSNVLNSRIEFMRPCSHRNRESLSDQECSHHYELSKST